MNRIFGACVIVLFYKNKICENIYKTSRRVRSQARDKLDVCRMAVLERRLLSHY